MPIYLLLSLLLSLPALVIKMSSKKGLRFNTVWSSVLCSKVHFSVLSLFGLSLSSLSLPFLDEQHVEQYMLNTKRVTKRKLEAGWKSTIEAKRKGEKKKSRKEENRLCLVVSGQTFLWPLYLVTMEWSGNWPCQCYMLSHTHSFSVEPKYLFWDWSLDSVFNAAE